MKRIWLIGFLVAAAVAAPGWSLAAGSRGRSQPVRVTATPSIGYPMTRFVIAFNAPRRTGRIGSRETAYDVVATASCGQSAETDVPPTHKGQRVQVTLFPAAAGQKPWCLGTIRGRLRDWSYRACLRASCTKATRPRFRTLARLSFLVVKAPSTDTTPPTFAGLERAFACTPGAQWPGETTPFTLTWQAATDDLTPSAKIVYDIYMATAPGAENFAQATWTTAPGMTSFRTPGLQPHGSYYFVARARDQAGNEDGNRVERRGTDPCY